jgi:hypothetical protein
MLNHQVVKKKKECELGDENRGKYGFTWLWDEKNK